MNVRGVKKYAFARTKAGTVDGYEWRCRNQSKDNRHDVVRVYTRAFGVQVTSDLTTPTGLDRFHVHSPRPIEAEVELRWPVLVVCLIE
ncbi:hypothetical protein TNCV_4094191 [Trichonephila clavipes]|nr:hypothetical protein TNCV_4094191 [Trichonephila clavipes]